MLRKSQHEKTHYFFKGVTLLVTHYNRGRSLERLLRAFRDLNCEFDEIVVSDDGSKIQYLDQLRHLQENISFRLITSAENRGLGHNLNKGQEAVKTPYTLYVQEDFIPTKNFPVSFTHALKFMEEDRGLDIVRFYAYFPYPYLLPYRSGFHKMIIKPWHLDYNKIYYYSDHPHLRRSDFLNKFGRYPEGIKGDRTEYKMCIKFIQKKGKGLFFGDYQTLFIQENSDTEPSTMSRKSWTTNNNFLIRSCRDIYRFIKYNYDLFFYKKNK